MSSTPFDGSRPTVRNTSPSERPNRVSHELPLHRGDLLDVGADEGQRGAPVDEPAEVGDRVAVHVERQRAPDVLAGEDAAMP